MQKSEQMQEITKKIRVKNFQELRLKIRHGLKSVATGRQKSGKQCKKVSKQERKQV